MKLEAVLNNLNSFEKNSFLKIIDSILVNNPKNLNKVEKILSGTNTELKNADNIIVAEVFSLVKDEFANHVKEDFVNTSSQLDILIDIIIRDGNCIMKVDWFGRLYEMELKKLVKKIKELKANFASPKSKISIQRQRDYKIYKSCLEVAYTNDDQINHDRKITQDELSILITLSNELELSQEEIKLINYMILPVVKHDVDVVANELKNTGVIFYSKKYHTIYIADEMVRVLRKIRRKEIADKYYRRVLRHLRNAQINIACRKHNIDWKLSNEEKIKEIISEGIPFSNILKNDIHKEDINTSDRKKFINDLWSKELKIPYSLKGVTLDDKVANLIAHFTEIEKDEKVGISVDGYEKLLMDMNEILPKLNNKLKSEFELQEESVLKNDYLLDYNIKPLDILELLDHSELIKFCDAKHISTRGDEIENILESYKDVDNLYLENYENIGFRNIAALKENGITLKEAELGIKFEDLTKTVFSKLGFNVDEELRRKFNTNKDKIDILLNLGNNELILIECKTRKESGYNKFSSVSRQLKAYTTLVKSNDYKVIKSLLVAPEFSDDFINDTELEYELNLSLISASALSTILQGFKTSKHKQLPYKLLMRDVLIREDRILKAINK